MPAAVRYYFSGRRNQNPVPIWVIPYFAVAAVVVVASHSVTLAVAVFAPAGALLAMRIFRTRQQDGRAFYVEIGADGLLVNLGLITEIAYEDIKSAELPRFALPGPLRPLLIISSLLSLAFGGPRFPSGRKGEIDQESVELKFRRTVWLSVAFPPFMLPKRSWRLHLENAASLQIDLATKLEAIN
jgi:hypothetical protein